MYSSSNPAIRKNKTRYMHTHIYTLGLVLHFADRDNAAVIEKLSWALEQRQKGLPTVPSTIGVREPCPAMLLLCIAAIGLRKFINRNVYRTPQVMVHHPDVRFAWLHGILLKTIRSSRVQWQSLHQLQGHMAFTSPVTVLLHRCVRTFALPCVFTIAFRMSCGRALTAAVAVAS